jgi:hypothetical protein
MHMAEGASRQRQRLFASDLMFVIEGQSLA